jgi:hypothetical protein
MPPAGEGGGQGGRAPRQGKNTAHEGGREGRDEGGEGGGAYRGTGVDRTDAATVVLGDESDVDRRKKRRGGERDEQGATPRLTGGPHMQRLPNRLRIGRASAPRPRAGGWAAPSWATAVPTQDAKGGEAGRGGKRRLGHGRLAGPRRERGEGQATAGLR